MPTLCFSEFARAIGVAAMLLTSIVCTPVNAASLPPNFGLGLRSDFNDLPWMTGSGIPWNYRYQYLNSGWEQWWSPTDGTFATEYANASISNGYIPVFTYYVGQGSVGYWGITADYYADFVTLLRHVAAASQALPTIIHLEPDMWGYMQQANGDNASWTPVSVASSGYPGLSGFANNGAGFAQALIYLRDTYAPNALLAYHASLWGPSNGYSPTNPNSDPVGTAQRVYDFYASLNARFDLLFHDPSDADAGYKVAVRGNSVASSWWDNAAFQSYLTYLTTIYNNAGLPQVIWQTPVGNTLYRTVNNTANHYQDTAVQYFLGAGNSSNLSNYANAGVIAILFGRGPDTSTDPDDHANDGITNPAPICGNPFCNPGDASTWNTAVAQSSDDDGGYLRQRAAAFYNAPADRPPMP